MWIKDENNSDAPKGLSEKQASHYFKEELSKHQLIKQRWNELPGNSECPISGNILTSAGSHSSIRLFCLFFCFLRCIYLAVPGLSCGMWDLVH